MLVLQHKTAPIETNEKRTNFDCNFALCLILSSIDYSVWIIIYMFWMNSMKCYLRETFYKLK